MGVSDDPLAKLKFSDLGHEDLAVPLREGVKHVYPAMNVLVFDRCQNFEVRQLRRLGSGGVTRDHQCVTPETGIAASSALVTRSCVSGLRRNALSIHSWTGVPRSKRALARATCANGPGLSF